jgi:hypothetical protein
MRDFVILSEQAHSSASTRIAQKDLALQPECAWIGARSFAEFTLMAACAAEGLRTTKLFDIGMDHGRAQRSHNFKLAKTLPC